MGRSRDISDIALDASAIVRGDAFKLLDRIPDKSIKLVLSSPPYNIGKSYERGLFESQDDYIAWMKKFIQTRLAWMEKQFPPLPKLTVGTGTGARMSLSAPAGEIYFTLDGSDPRASGGEVARTARLYREPVTLADGSKIFARVRQENRWSGPVLVP